MKTALFLGCNMPAIRPDIERSIRLSFDSLGVEIVDLEGYVCCPAFGTFASMEEHAQLAVNAWNYALAEERGVDIVAQCGSCYSSLKLGHHTLCASEKLKAEVNAILAKGGKTFGGKSVMRHMTDFLYHQVGLERIRASVKKPLTGMHVVVQYPCHTRFPSSIVGFEKSSGRPAILRQLVEALGATVDTFSLEYACCGGSGGFHKASSHEAEAFTKRKYDAIKAETQAQAIVGSCITCVMYLDKTQKHLSTDGAEYNLPVFDYNQLLALAQGHSVEQVAKISVIPREPFLAKVA